MKLLVPKKLVTKTKSGKEVVKDPLTKKGNIKKFNNKKAIDIEYN
jgi:hypothetical protein